MIPTELISPEYLETQIELHNREGELYGTSGSRYAVAVRRLIEEYKADSVLDYGCGKGYLKNELGEIVSEYDPAIAGKDGPPQPAHIVVCTDVLEHIEPEKLDTVLEHIRALTLKANLFVIATRPANKTLKDGRNAHLIQESAEWWRKKLDVMFDVQTWDISPLGIICTAKPFMLVGEIKGKGAVSDDERHGHVRANVKVTRKRVKVCQPHGRVAILMCYGPSLEDTWSAAIEEKKAIGNADIVSVSGAHDYLIERGIVPRYHVECDPRKHKGDMITKPQAKTEYLMASCCHPEVIGKLARKKLRLWHLDNGMASHRGLSEIEPGAIMVGGGGSVGLRAIPLLMMMGYRRFIIHGMDCSYREDKTHAGKHTGKKTDVIEVRCGGRKFLSAPVLITYLRNFDDMRMLHCGSPDVEPNKIEIILRGDGLLQHALLTGGGAKAADNQEAA